MKSNEPSSFRAPESGSVLVITAWVLFLLALLGVAVGVQASRRLEAAGHIRDRAQAYGAARAAVARAIAVLGLETNGWDALTERWADSPADFREVPCGDAFYSVLRPEFGASATTTGVCFGAMDENARVDVNQADRDVLRGLLMTAGEVDEHRAVMLASNLVAARVEAGDGTAPPVRRPFLCSRDLLAVEGMDETLLQRLEPHVTVHGGGRRVNINTAGPVVLRSLLRRGDVPAGAGQDAVESLTRKVLQFREGGGIFTTHRGAGLLEALSGGVEVEDGERALLYGLEPVVTVVSDRFRIVGVGESGGGRRLSRRVECVWNRTARTVEFWYED